MSETIKVDRKKLEEFVSRSNDALVSLNECAGSLLAVVKGEKDLEVLKKVCIRNSEMASMSAILLKKCIDQLKDEVDD